MIIKTYTTTGKKLRWKYSSSYLWWPYRVIYFRLVFCSSKYFKIGMHYFIIIFKRDEC